VPEHGGRRDRLGDEAHEPDNEKPQTKVPHVALIVRTTPWLKSRDDAAAKAAAQGSSRDQDLRSQILILRRAQSGGRSTANGSVTSNERARKR
jgi:hypothetical protein